MKIHFKLTVLLSAVAVLISLTGCKEITTTTKIFPDGSCERTIEVPGDSAAVDSVFTGPFFMPVDSTWLITHKKDTTWKTTGVKGGKKTERNDNKRNIAQKRFRKVADMNRLYEKQGKDALQVRVQAGLVRKFRWFNTFYEYTETIKPAGPYPNTPIQDFLKREELDMYYIDEDTLDLDEKTEQWLWKAYFEELFAALVRASETMPDQKLTSELIRASKDSLFAAFKRADSDNIENGAELTAFLAKFYRSRAVTRWKGPMDDVMKSLAKKQEFVFDLNSDSYENSVIMPGLIYDTNASTVEGNRAVWKYKGNRLFWEDYVMRVESRVVNGWAIWVTGGLLLAALAGLVLTTVLRKRPA